MRLLRMKPGHGEVLIAEGDVEIAEQERELIEAFGLRTDDDQSAGSSASTASYVNDVMEFISSKSLQTKSPQPFCSTR